MCVCIICKAYGHIFSFLLVEIEDDVDDALKP